MVRWNRTRGGERRLALPCKHGDAMIVLVPVHLWGGLERDLRLVRAAFQLRTEQQAVVFRRIGRAGLPDVYQLAMLGTAGVLNQQQVRITQDRREQAQRGKRPRGVPSRSCAYEPQAACAWHATAGTVKPANHTSVSSRPKLLIRGVFARGPPDENAALAMPGQRLGPTRGA